MACFPRVRGGVPHAATFVESAAEIAVAMTGAVPSFRFIHETAANAFTLDIADRYRATVTIPIAFMVAKRANTSATFPLDREVRYESAKVFRTKGVISSMIDDIHHILDLTILEDVDDNSDEKCE